MRPSRDDGGGGNPPSPGSGYDIFIRNLLEDTRAGTLAQFFKDHVGDAGRVIRPPRLALARGFAWITFDTLAAVREALNH